MMSGSRVDHTPCAVARPLLLLISIIDRASLGACRRRAVDPAVASLSCAELLGGSFSSVEDFCENFARRVR